MQGETKRKRNEIDEDDDSDYAPSDNETTNVLYDDPPSRKSTRQHSMPIEYWKANANSVEFVDLYEPATFADAMKCTDKAHWIHAIKEELDSM